MARCTTGTGKVVHVKRSFLYSSRHYQWEDVGWRCRYCGKSVLIEQDDGTFLPDYRTMTMDHIVPRSEGGPTDETNLAPSCSQCNNRKGSSSLEKFRGRLFPIFPGQKKIVDQRFAYERWADGEDGSREGRSEAAAD